MLSFTGKVITQQRHIAYIFHLEVKVENAERCLTYRSEAWIQNKMC